MHTKSQSIPVIKPTFSQNPVTRTAKDDLRNVTSVRSILLNSRQTNREGSMDHYKGPIGNEAKIDFYDSYKKLSEITERNKYSHLEDNPNIAYLKEIDKKNLKPVPFGVIRAKGSEKTMNLNGMSMGDNYAAALSKSFKNINFVEVFNARNNRLSEKGSKVLLKALDSQRLQDLNLSDNRLGAESIDQLIRLLTKDSSTLRILNLENINTKETSMVKLISSLASNSSLSHLNLAKNNLTVHSAGAVKSLLQANHSLQRLDLHWNVFNLDAGLLIFEGMESNRTLQELDMSFNSIGVDPSKFEKLSEMLALNKCLLHLDLSYNKLGVNEASILAESIKDNHTLLGLHMEGNHSSVNANGFIEIITKPKLKETALEFKRIFKARKDSDNCWVCGNWIEFSVSADLALSPPVYIHFEVDKYEPYLMKPLGKYSITRVFPAGKQKFFLSNNEKPFVFDHFSQVDQRVPHEFRSASESVLVKKMNSVQIQGERLSLNSPFSTVPRVRERHSLKDSEERIEWKFESAIFKDYLKENKNLLDNCFELDWSLSRLEGFVRDPEDRAKAKAYLKANYQTIRLIYKSLSSSAANEIFSIGSNTLTDFLYQCKIIDQTYSINDFGVNWNSTNVALNKSLVYNPGNALVRYELMEFLVRVSFDKFVRSKSLKTVKKSIKKLMKDFIFPNISEYKCNKISSLNTNWWRDNFYFAEDVDITLKIYKPILESIFAKYSGRKTLPGCKKFMSLEEFYDLCKEAELVTDDISNREVTFCFVQSMMTQVDEYNKSRHFEMNFLEFLEAITRVCDMRDNRDISLKDKMLNSLQNLLKLCPKSISEAFELPGESTFHKLKFKAVRY